MKLLRRLIVVAGYHQHTLIVDICDVVHQKVVLGYDRLLVVVHHLRLNGLCSAPRRLSECSRLHHIIHIFMNNL